MLAFVALGLLPAPSRAASRISQGDGDGDRWFGRDKALHFGASAALAAAGYGAAVLAFEDRSARLFTGAGLALTLGIAKELDDLSGHGTPSWKDLTWDAIGAATGLAVAYVVDRFVLSPLTASPSANAKQSMRTGAHPAGLGVLFVF